MTESIADKKWKQIFSDLDIPERIAREDSITISAEKINEYRECRLMTKFDHSSNLPKVFKDNQLGILPLSRSEFLIGKFNVYHNLEAYNERPIHIPLRDDIATLPESPEKITSEQIALACAHTSGVLRAYMNLDEDASLIPTISGRCGSGIFQYSLQGHGMRIPYQFSVRNAQIEIDAVYETLDTIYLFEAKNHECEDFIIRQLYYPYRYISNLTGSRKKVIPVFMKYVNGTYTFYEYGFHHAERFDSIAPVRQASYSYNLQNITTADLDALIGTPTTGELPNIPFPQADAFSRVEDIANALKQPGTALSAQEIITLNLDFAPRQADYYINAGAYLGIYQKNALGRVELTAEGRRIFDMPYRDRNLALARKILEKPVFSECYSAWLASGGTGIDKAYICDALQRHREEINQTTAGRRASTVRSWLKWITDLVE